MNSSLFSEWMCFETLPSTNDYIKSLCEAKPTGGLVAVSDTQSSGKGRTGRTFASPKGGAYFSFSLVADLPADRIPAITLLAGLAVYRAIFRLSGIETFIKWPNDLLWQGRKLCGILTEGKVKSDGSLCYAVVGIGVNLAGKATDFPKELQRILCTLEEAGECIPRDAFIAEVLSQFEALWQNGNFWENMGDIMREYTGHLAWRDETVQILRGDETTHGRLLGVNEEGELLLSTEKGLCIFSSGELHLRPAKVCAFSGNRTLSHSRMAVAKALDAEIARLFEEGYTVFRAGGAGGFDTLAALSVLRLKQLHPQIYLELLIPFPNFKTDDPDFEETLSKADRVVPISPCYSPFCMSVRNQALIDGSDLLLLYNYQSKGGSVQTANFAAKANVAIRKLPI